MQDAIAGPSSLPFMAAPSAHPSFPAVATLCKRYPTQASALFQTYLDLKNGAAAWDIVEPLSLSLSPNQDIADTAGRDLSGLTDEDADQLVRQRLEEWKRGDAKLGLVHGSAAETAEGEEEGQLLETGLGAIKGRRKDAKKYEIVVPLTIAQHLRPSQLKAIFTLINAHAASCPPGQEVDTSHVLLAIIAPDSTLVYYVVSQGMVKPVN